MIGVEETPQQTDRYGLRLEARRLFRNPLDLGLAEGQNHDPIRHPLARPETPVAGNQGRKPAREESVQCLAVLSPDSQQIGEPLGTDEDDPRTAALEQCIGGHRHAVDEACHRLRPDVRFTENVPDDGHDAVVLWVGRESLGGKHAPTGDQDGVGEGAAHIDPKEHPRRGLRGLSARGEIAGPRESLICGRRTHGASLLAPPDLKQDPAARAGSRGRHGVPREKSSDGPARASVSRRRRPRGARR